MFRRTAQNVYKDIYENLKRGNFQPLLEHWRYYYTREKGAISISEEPGGFIFHVTDCPAVRHLKERNVPVKKSFFLQISLLNEAWSEGTPFVIETQIIRDGEYKMTVRRRSNDSK